MTGAIGIDLGGTRIKGVLISSAGQVVHQLNRPTLDSGHSTSEDTVWMKSVAAMVAELKAMAGPGDLCIGISAPGLPDEVNQAIAFMPGRLQGLEKFKWGEYLGSTTWVLNDGVAALVAECRLGAAKGKRNVVMITLGTGVGGAILIDGKPYQGSFQKAGHIGHMVIDDEGDADVTGMPGSLEECIGNVTIEKRTKGKFASTAALLNAMRDGDSFARDVWMKSVRQLAIGAASVTNILSPEVIVIGGGITVAGDDLFGPLAKYMAQYEWRAGGNAVEIVKATFGEYAGATGAALFALGRKKESE
jgi:glucokinase